MQADPQRDHFWGRASAADPQAGCTARDCRDGRRAVCLRAQHSLRAEAEARRRLAIGQLWQQGSWGWGAAVSGVHTRTHTHTRARARTHAHTHTQVRQTNMLLEMYVTVCNGRLCVCIGAADQHAAGEGGRAEAPLPGPCCR